MVFYFCKHSVNLKKNEMWKMTSKNTQQSLQKNCMPKTKANKCFSGFTTSKIAEFFIGFAIPKYYYLSVTFCKSSIRPGCLLTKHIQFIWLNSHNQDNSKIFSVLKKPIKSYRHNYKLRIISLPYLKHMHSTSHCFVLVFYFICLICIIYTIFI